MRTHEELIADAEKFATAQRDLAGRQDEDSRHWHHIALADLLLEMSRELSVCKCHRPLSQ